MKYVPNRIKLCKYCNRPILYNENYSGIDRLNSKNEVITEIWHTDCSYSNALSGALSGGVVIPQNSTGIAPWNGTSWNNNSTNNWSIAGMAYSTNSVSAIKNIPYTLVDPLSSYPQAIAVSETELAENEKPKPRTIFSYGGLYIKFLTKRLFNYVIFLMDKIFRATYE